MIAIWKKQGGTLSKYYHPQEKLYSAAYRLCKPVCSPGLDKVQENKHRIRLCCLVASPLRSRRCLSLSSLEHTLNVSPVLLNLLSLMHWTCWLTRVAPHSRLHEARVKLLVQDRPTAWHYSWGKLSGSQSQRGYSSFATRCHLLSSHVQQSLNTGCTWSTWAPLLPAQPTASQTFPPQAWLRHIFENKSGGGTLNDTILPSSSNCKREPSPAAGDNFTHHKLLRSNSLCTSLRTGGVFCSDTDTYWGWGRKHFSPPQWSQTRGRHHLIRNNE